MEKLKNLLNPGAKHDDEILYGSGISSDPVNSGKTQGERGEASRFTSVHNTSGTDINSSSANPATLSGTLTTLARNPTRHSQNSTETVQDPVTNDKAIAGSTDFHIPTTEPSAPVDDFSGRGQGATVSKGLPTPEPFSQTEQSLAMPGSLDNDASSTTAIHKGVPGDSHLTPRAPGAELNKDLPAEPTSHTISSHLRRDAGLGAGSIALDEATHSHEKNRIPEDNDSSGRLFPLGVAKMLSNSSSSYAKSSSDYRQIANHPTTTDPANVGANFQTDTIRAQNLERDSRKDISKDAELGSYGPESWQHDHNKHGHQFVPVKQHETMMGALLDPHASSGLQNLSTESQPHLGGETALGGTALAGAGVAWERSRDHPTSSTTLTRSTPFMKRADDYKQFEQQPVSATTANSTLTERAKANERDYDLSATLPASSSSSRELAPKEIGLSGPVHKSSILNKLDPRVKELPATANTGDLEQPRSSAPFSSSSPSFSKIDPQLNAEPRRNIKANLTDSERDATTAGNLGGVALSGPGYEKERKYENPSLRQEPAKQPEKRGYMGVGDTGFDHDRSELDPQYTSYAPPSAATQALHQMPYQRTGDLSKDGRTEQNLATQQVKSLPGSEAEQTTQRHFNQDVAIVGLGAATEDSTPHYNQTQPRLSTQLANESNSQNLGQKSENQYRQDTAVPGIRAVAAEGTRHNDKGQPMLSGQTTNSDFEKYVEQDSHYGRDATVGGIGGVAASQTNPKDEKLEAEFSKKEAEHTKALEKEHEKEVKALEKEHKKEEKALAKEHEKEEKAIAYQEKEEAKHDKAVAKEQKKHEKESKALEKERKQQEKIVAKEQEGYPKHDEQTSAGIVAEKQSEEYDKHSTKEEKRHEKMHAALEKAHSREERQFEKAQKEHEKESDEAHGEKKHRGILGLFHRDKKSRKEAGEEELENRSHSSYGLTSAKPAEAGVVTPAAHNLTEHEKQQHEKHERHRLHKDPPASSVTSGNTPYAEAPKSGYAAHVTGGTGTTALAQGEEFHSGSHLSDAGNRLDPFVDDRGTTFSGEQNKVVDPRTGLPVDLSKGQHGHGTDNTPMPHDGIFPSAHAVEGQDHGSQILGDDIGTAR